MQNKIQAMIMDIGDNYYWPNFSNDEKFLTFCGLVTKNGVTVILFTHSHKKCMSFLFENVRNLSSFPLSFLCYHI